MNPKSCLKEKYDKKGTKKKTKKKTEKTNQNQNKIWLRGGVKLEFVRNLFDSKICDSFDSKGQKIFEKFDEN